MNKEFIPYEQALELKELGFDERTLDAYYKTTDGGVSLLRFIDKGRQINYPFVRIPAPLYQQAFRWFREKYNLSHLDLLVMHIFEWKTPYEEAELACLNKLIEIVKNK
jgi:hypothetical protein